MDTSDLDSDCSGLYDFSKRNRNYYIKKIDDEHFEIYNLSHDWLYYKIVKLTSNNTYIAYHLRYENAMLGNFNTVEQAFKACTDEELNPTWI